MSQKHVDKSLEDQDVGRAQEDQGQRDPQTTIIGKEQPQVVPTSQTSPPTIEKPLFDYNYYNSYYNFTFFIQNFQHFSQSGKTKSSEKEKFSIHFKENYT